MTEKRETIDVKKAPALAAEWLNRAGAFCEKRPAWSLLAALCIPELFLLVMGMACKAMPQLLMASSAIFVSCIVLWVAGLSLWARALVRRCKGKHVRSFLENDQERSPR